MLIEKRKLRNWLLVILGMILILYGSINLFDFIPIPGLVDLASDHAVDQEGFAPVFLPVPDDTTAIDQGSHTSPEYIPDRIVIEEIELDAPIVIADSVRSIIDGQEVVQFLVPEKFAAGWHENSAPLGEIGNTVINGHHNAFGKVFERLVDLKSGSELLLKSGNRDFYYTVTNKFILPEKDQPLDVRLDNGRWILPSNDERITLLTCWPKRSNSHRLIIVAVPTLSE